MYVECAGNWIVHKRPETSTTSITRRVKVRFLLSTWASFAELALVAPGPHAHVGIGKSKIIDTKHVLILVVPIRTDDFERS